MPKVPVYEQQVETRTPTVQTQTFSRPVEGAFGGQVAEAYGKLGDTTAKLGNAIFQRVIERQEQEDERQVLDVETKFRQEMQNTLYSKEADKDGKPKGFLTRQLGQAKDATPEFDSTFHGLREKYLEGVTSERQKQALGSMLDKHYLSARDSVIRHEVTQGDENFKNTLNSNLKQRVMDAAAIADPAKLIGAIDEAKALQSTGLKRLGMDENAVKLSNELIAADIAKSSISAMIDRDPMKAQSILAAATDRLPASTVAELRKVIDGKTLDDERQKVWNQATAFRLPDGNPDETKMEKFVLGMENVPTERKEKIWDYVKSRAAEQRSQKTQHEAAFEHQFMNEVYAGKKKGTLQLTDALKLATDPKFGFDAYEMGQKEEAVKKLYDHPVKTDPATYMGLWEGVQDKKVLKEDIDHAMKAGRISVQDWEGLRKDYFKMQNQGEDSAEKLAWERVKVLAEDKYGNDKEKRDSFMYVMHGTAKGKAPEEIWAIASEKLKEVPGTGSWFFGINKKKQWEVNMTQQDAQNEVWGKVYQDVGRAEVLAIGQGALAKGKPSWGLADVDQLANEVGGDIKPGTPAHNAIQSLMKRGELVTPANIKAILSQRPDGKY